MSDTTDLALQTTQKAVLSRLASLQITNDADFVTVAEWLAWNRDVQKQVKAHHDPICEAKHKEHKSATAARAALLDPLIKGDGLASRMMSVYRAEQERKRREEQAKLDAEAKKRAEDAVLAEAEETGDESLLDQPLDVPVVRAAPIVQPEGFTFVVMWKFRIVDATKIPRQWLMLDEKKVQKQIEATKMQTAIEGIQVYEEKIPRRTRGAS